MSVITATPTRSRGPRHTINSRTLTAQTNLIVHHVLAELGIDDAGYTSTDTPGSPDPAYRAAISAATAYRLGIHLRHGHEITKCADCGDIADADTMREGADGGWRCTDALPNGDSCNGLYETEYGITFD